MAVKIRLSRHGKKGQPFYRVVAADVQARRDGRFLEILGTYDPNRDPAQISLNSDRIKYWLDNGALPTDTVRSLFRKHLDKQD